MKIHKTQPGTGYYDTRFLKLDQTTPQTITASPILNWLTASQALMTDANKKLVSVDMDTQIKRLSFLNS